jgi:tripartite-type tricarboxylate transporter receptor subunit TctC
VRCCGSAHAPARLPHDIGEAVNRAVTMGLSASDVQQRFRRDGLVTKPMSMTEFEAFIAFEATRWKPVIERAGLVGAKLD